MLSIPFYHSLLKKYVIIFGSLFNNIRIEKLDSNGNVLQTLKVPIAYGPREKFLARVESNPSGNEKNSVILPRMGFEITNITYANERKLQTIQTVKSNNNINGNNVYKKAYTPVPYDINFALHIMVKQTDDGTRIIEQILPYFTPEWTISAKLLSDFDQYTDIPIVIGPIQIDDAYEGGFTERRSLTYTINFTMKAYLYGPISQQKIIKFTDVNLINPVSIDQLNANTGVLITNVIQPGLDANGDPTTLIANSVPYSQINETDPYGIIKIITDLPNG
jgi:hypothetical protein